MAENEFLPEPLPSNPMPLFVEWFREARAWGQQPNPDAMVLATVGNDGAPSARVVLCKRIDDVAGHIVFFTNYESRKGRELAAHPRAAVVMHWDSMHRQVRIEGPVIRSPAGESDDYFASRALLSRIGAWASDQSRPLPSRETLAHRVESTATKFGVNPASEQGSVPRPPHWGGHRLWIESIEMWVEGPGRVHDRARWTRTLTRRDEFSFDGAPWQATRLYP